MSSFGDPRSGSAHLSQSGQGTPWCNQLQRHRQPGPSLTPSKTEDWKDATIAVHSGSYIEPNTGAVGTPIFQNSTFLLGPEQYKSVEEGYARDKFIYSRYGNPSQWAVQDKLSALEGAESSLVFSSGMAAIACTVIGLMDKGAHLVTSMDLYGGTYNFFHQELPSLGMQTSFVDPQDLDAIEAAIRPETQLLYFEVVSNPLLKVADLKKLRALADKYKIRLVIDGTFATPVNCRILDHGVDVVVHSASKYLNGHSDLIAGTVSGSRKLIDRIWPRLLSYGGCMDPHSCFLLERGLKTLPLRMKAHNENSLAIAQFLEKHPLVKAVHHPLLESGRDYHLASEHLKGGSGMVAFEVVGGDPAALKLARSLKLFIEATSLGGVESLISLPFNTSHATMTEKQRVDMGINPGCVRLSAGIEDKDDLIQDLEQGLHVSQKESTNA